MALLIGYGAGAINPYLAFESIEDLIAEGLHGLGGIDPHKAVRNYIKACGKGVLKVMSKMGVSTVASYTGAQIFEAIGLGERARRAVLHRHRQPPRRHRPRRDRRGGRGPPRRRPTRRVPRSGPTASSSSAASTSGAARARSTCSTRTTVFKLQHATRAKRYDIFRQYSRLVDDQSTRLATLRGLFEFKDGGPRSRSRSTRSSRSPSIVRRFSTGAMSYGSISAEAHETLAIAMNRLGAKSNTGEGGEDADRLHDPAAPVGDQAGRLGTLRRHGGVPHQRRRPADQDGPGRQARRGRPAARPQGVPVDRQDPALHARRRPDQPAAAPRHLLDRGPQAADPRPQERQPGGARPREARRRGRASAPLRPGSARRRPTSC